MLTTPDVSRTVAASVTAGCEPRRERIGGSALSPLRQVFVRAGEVILEIVGPNEVVADGIASSAGCSLWGLAFTTADLDACSALLGDGMGAPRDAVQKGRRIASLRHTKCGISVPTAFMSE